MEKGNIKCILKTEYQRRHIIWENLKRIGCFVRTHQAYVSDLGKIKSNKSIHSVIRAHTSPMKLSSALQIAINIIQFIARAILEVKMCVY